MTLISARDSGHDFIVKFSPSMCVVVVVSLTGEIAAQSFAYHANWTADSNKLVTASMQQRSCTFQEASYSKKSTQNKSLD